MATKQATHRFYRFGRIVSLAIFFGGIFLLKLEIDKKEITESFQFISSFTIGLGVTIIGVMMFFATHKYHLKLSFYFQQNKIHPDSPWQWRRDWLKGIVKNARRDSTITYIALIGLLSLTVFLLSTINYGFSNELSQYNSTKVIGFLFFFLSIIYCLHLLIKTYFKELFQQIRLGNSFVTFSNPVKPGKKAKYNITIPFSSTETMKFQGTLYCQNMTFSTSNGNYIERNKNLWFEKQESIAISRGRKSSCEFEFNIKDDLPSSVIEGTGVHWILEIKNLSGQKYETTFLVPVG